MKFSKQYFQDKFILLLLSVNAFLVVLTILLILFRLGSGHTDYLVQCRDCSNLQAIGRFTKGSLTDILAFIVFVLGVFSIHTGLSARLFSIHRQLSVVVLAMGTLLLVTTMIVSYALLSLR